MDRKSEYALAPLLLVALPLWIVGYPYSLFGLSMIVFFIAEGLYSSIRPAGKRRRGLICSSLGAGIVWAASYLSLNAWTGFPFAEQAGLSSFLSAVAFLLMLQAALHRSGSPFEPAYGE